MDTLTVINTWFADMQCPNLVAEVQQLVKDCGGSDQPFFAGKKFVNGNGFYVLVTKW
jgi:hypothetical protein